MTKLVGCSARTAKYVATPVGWGLPHHDRRSGGASPTLRGFASVVRRGRRALVCRRAILVQPLVHDGGSMGAGLGSSMFMTLSLRAMAVKKSPQEL